tara:strand:+ start:417 stop:1163 length:747 start_codon:yes stop_codon:yes gene_type:complete
MWSPQTLLKLSSYNELISGKVPALIIPGILSKTDCSSLSSKISDILITNKNTKKFGTSLSSHIYEKSQYFSNAKKSNDFLKKLFAQNTSPIISMHKTISKIFQKQITTASENGMTYSDAVIRIHGNNDSVHLHRDNSHFEMNHYNVSCLKNQLSAILYLQSPQEGGELTIFHKMWSRDDERMREPDFGYSSKLIKDINQTKISPIEGDMVVLNPKFYHQIESVSGLRNRISIGFFFGELSKNNFCSWS